MRRSAQHQKRRKTWTLTSRTTYAHVCGVDDGDEAHAERPRTRSECPTTRPCPWVGCRHHLYLDVNAQGSIKMDARYGVWETPGETCALDVAEAGPHTISEVAALIGTTYERVRQIEEAALAKLGLASWLAEHLDHG